MNPQDRMLLKSELANLNGRLSACSGLLQAAKGNAAAPPVAPPGGGPVVIPALSMICETMQLQQEALTNAVRLMERIIDRA